MASPPDDPRGTSNAAPQPQGSADGTAAAPAPEAPVRSEDAPNPNKRRSDRVMVAIAIDVNATDIHGAHFEEACVTEMVSLHGATIALANRASSEHPVRLRRRALDLEVQARILGQMGLRPGRNVYGVAFLEDAPDFWGIRFPPPEESADSLARTALMCAECGQVLLFALNEIEFRVFEANQRLAFGCESCGRNVVWMPVPSNSGFGKVHAAANPHDRKHARTRMKAAACIQEPGKPDDLVEVLDISRGGVSFRGRRPYEVNSWIHFAVPYTPAAANIFVSGRVAWRRDIADDVFEHGVQYVKG